MKRKFLTAEWRKLAIANYDVDPAILLPYLPYKTELDIWQDKCYVSLVGFKFAETKIMGLKIPMHHEFEEVNLRFYVRYKEGNEWKRGVTFIREIVPRRAITMIANNLYSEKYITLRMKHRWDTHDKGISIEYHWRHKRKWNIFSIIADAQLQDIAHGSEEEFITEHYWGYTHIHKSRTSEYGVEHPRWQVYPVIEYKIDVDFGDLYGNEFEFLGTTQPDSVMLAEGSEIVVRSANKIR